MSTLRLLPGAARRGYRLVMSQRLAQNAHAAQSARLNCVSHESCPVSADRRERFVQAVLSRHRYLVTLLRSNHRR